MQPLNGARRGDSPDLSKDEPMSPLSKLFRFIVALVIAFYFWTRHLIRAVLPKKYLAKNIAGEVCVVTGAGSGIGQLMTQKFAREGCRMVAMDINVDGLEETARLVRKEGFEISTYICNVGDRKAVYEVFDKVKREVGTVGILVNNAGIVAGNQFFTDMDDDAMERTMNINATAHFWTTKAVLGDMMKANHGHIVSIASLAGLVGLNRLVAYCASKFAARGFMESLQAETILRGYNGIKFTTVCPYFINTGMFHGVKTSFEPFLEPDYVAQETVDATLCNRERIMLPYFMNILVPITSSLSGDSIPSLNKLFGVMNAMDSFDAEHRHLAKKIK